MSCKALKLKGCEVAGSTFNGRKFTFTDRQINQDTFSAKVYNFQNTLITEIQGVKNANDVYFSFDELESQKIGSYKIEYWANLKDIAIEMIAIESFKISSEPCDCASSSDANFTLEIKEESINYSLSISVINIGGSGSGSDGKSAYEIAVENGFVGSESEWLDSLKGADGKDGVDGINGRDGVDGKDGYTPIKGVDYFDGEQGLKGDKGEQGIQGTQGKQGLPGAKGDKGDKGDDAAINFATQPEMESQTPPTTENKKVVSLFGLWKWWNKRKVEVTNEIDNKTSSKADKTYVDNGLSLKADKTELTTEVNRLDGRINGKADTSEIGRLDVKINSNVNVLNTDKADKIELTAEVTRLDNRINNKADTSEIGGLDIKINTNVSAINTDMALKADRNGGNLNASDVASFRSKLNNFATQAEMENTTPPTSETEKEVSLFGLWKWWDKVKRKVNGITVSDIPNANNDINYGKNLVIRDNGDFGLEDRGTIVNKRNNANVNIWIGSVTQHNNATPKPSGLVFIHED